jgi:hypothetical protein
MKEKEPDLAVGKMTNIVLGVLVVLLAPPALGILLMFYTYLSMLLATPLCRMLSSCPKCENDLCEMVVLTFSLCSLIAAGLYFCLRRLKRLR